MPKTILVVFMIDAIAKSHLAVFKTAFTIFIQSSLFIISPFNFIFGRSKAPALQIYLLPVNYLPLVSSIP